jgi:Restriction Enzyme Adenine Methylase Associated/GIY-YIG catalytic domain
MAKRSQLVCQQLENISSVVLEEYQDIIKQYIRGRNGVYAMYKAEKLYYVGLATNLRGRLKQHLKDRHRGLWDRFSVYLTIGDQHIKEMESLLLRILRPAGNKQLGKFTRCESLNKKLARDIKTLQREELATILGDKRSAVAGRDSADDRPVLQPYVALIRRNRLRARYKGTLIRARVRADGAITVRGTRGRKFNSPSLAAQHVLKRNANGWDFWQYERSPGEWVRLTRLRD